MRRIPLQISTWTAILGSIMAPAQINAQAVGIGLTTPQARLHIRVPSGWNQPILQVDTSGTPILILTPQGFLGIGTNTPSTHLHVQGGAYIRDTLRIDGDFRPGGNPGTPGMVLTSQGPGLPPIWAPGSGQTRIYFASAPQIVCATSNSTFTPIIPLTSVPLQAGDTVLVWASGSIAPSTSCSPPDNYYQDCGKASAYIRVRMAPAPSLQVGGNTHETVHWSVGGLGPNHEDDQDTWTLMGVFVANQTGNHTFVLEAQYAGGSSGCYPKFWSGNYYGGAMMILQVIR